MKRFILFLLLSAACCGMAQAEASPPITILFASPDGTGDGHSADSPTDIQSVKTLARSYNATNNVTIYLRGGTYDMISAGPLEFTSADSGQNGYQVVWRNYPGDAPPILSGGVQITGWTLHDAGKNIWRAPVPSGYKARQFWVNGQRAERTKWFSGTSFSTTRTQDSPYWKEELNNANFPGLAYPTDVELVQRADTVASMADWRHLTWGVTAVSRVGNVTTFSIPQGIKTIDDDYEYNDNLWLGSTFSWVENAYEFLDSTTKGHWFLPSTENFIYYVPRDREDMATAECWLPHSEVLVKSLSGLANVTFLGISFRHTGWLKPTAQKSFIEVQANNYLDSSHNYRHWNQPTLPVGLFPQAAVEIYGADNVNFEQCEFTQLGGTGLYMGLGCHDCSVSGNIFADISSNSLNVGSIVWLDADDGTSEATNHTPAVKTENILIQSNHIYDIANQYNGGVGIFLGYTDNIKVIHNHIHDVPYTGISLGWGWTWLTEDWYLDPTWGMGIRDYSGYNEIAYNSINDTMQVLFDGGAVYSIAEQPGSIIHDNYITNCGHTYPPWGLNPIYHDEGSRYGESYNNIILKNVAYGPEYAITANLDMSRGELSAHHNYFTTPIGLYGYGSVDLIPGAGTWGNTVGNTSLPDDPSAWPAAAQAIAAAAGPELVLHSDIVGNMAVIFGWKPLDAVLSIDPEQYYTVSDYEEFDTGMWRATVSGITDNFAALVVVVVTAPAITTNPVPGATVSSLFTYDVDATGNPAPTYNLVSGPAGMTIDPETGLIEWAPVMTGSFDVMVEATNTHGSDSVTFTIQVIEPVCTDQDGDGFADAACGGSDCHDGNPAIRPGASEVCGDGIDQDCSGADLACDPNTIDNDGDGYAENTGDCDDTNPGVNPGAPEVCGDGIDQDCDGTDKVCPCPDTDGDGFADAACGGSDCNDDDPAINPDLREKGKKCQDAIDNDCDGLIDGNDPDCARGGDTGGTTGDYENNRKTCTDGIDNDGDGLTDCADPDCAAVKICK